MSPAASHEEYSHDVLVIGAGGAGLRAAIEAADAGASVGLICKSLLGKAHTVMAEGGVAAALANVAENDTWQTHFRDTMVGGKMLNHWRMAQLHAQEAPERVRELEYWGAVFDRTRDGRILQRPFGGHSHPRLAHVGDRTGLEMIRTLQDRTVQSGVTVYMECTTTQLMVDDGRVTGAFGYWRQTGDPITFAAKAVVLATGGIGRIWQITSNSWEYSGDGHALAYRAGAELIDMEFVQFHPTGMVWPPGVRGLLVTEAVRGEGGILRNKEAERFMWRYLPEDRRHEYAETDEEASRWVEALSEGRTTDARMPPELSTRDNVARAIYTEVREGRGSGHGGVFLDISYLAPDHVRAQAAVDVRAVQGIGRRRYHRRADGGRPHLPLRDGRRARRSGDGGQQRARPVRGGGGGRRHARCQPAGRQLAVRPAGIRAARRGIGRGVREGAGRRAEAGRPSGPQGEGRAAGALRPRWRRGSVSAPSRPAGHDAEAGRHLPHIRRSGRGDRDIATCASGGRRCAATGTPAYNPGWNLVFELRNMLVCSEAVARARSQRTESRGAHAAPDFPGLDAEWGKRNTTVSRMATADAGRGAPAARDAR